MRGNKMIFHEKALHKRLAVILLAGSLAAMLTGCGSAKGYSSDIAAVANGSSLEMASESMMDSGFYATNSTIEEAKETSASTEMTKDTTDVTATDRKLIKTVDMDVETREFDYLMETVEEQVKALGGYIENLNTYNGSSYSGYRGTRNADLTIRIPKQQLDAFLDTVSGASNVIRRSDNVEDVTLAYVDLESHRDALRTEQTRLLELLERAETIEDIITIEERLSNVRYQLESMESQLRTYDNKVDYSTVYLNIDEVEIYTPVEEDTVWERISSGFAESLHDIGEGLVDFGVWFVVTIPYMVVWSIIIVILIFIFYGVVKLFQNAGTKRKQKKTVTGQPPVTVQEEKHE